VSPRSILLVAPLAGLLACTAGPARPAHHPAPLGWSAPLAAAWIGHATVLMKLGDAFVLSDPAFFDRVGVRVAGVTIGPRRVVAPALGIAELPPLAAIVITHAHMDSLDLPSLRALPKDTTLVAPTGCRDLLGNLGFRRYVELAWGERVTADGVTIEAVPVRHWGRRWPWGRDRGYNGYLLERDGRRVLFASDTAYTPDFARWRDGSHALTLAILGNGAYDPWIRHHADPEQAWSMFLDSGARWLAPVHHDTFRLGREPLGDAMRRLTAAAGPQADRIVFHAVGDEWELPSEGGDG
jgi:L-ascorbate metabolism protein UlaG (beta-lactamase superfamily)